MQHLGEEGIAERSIVALLAGGRVGTRADQERAQLLSQALVNVEELEVSGTRKEQLMNGQQPGELLNWLVMVVHPQVDRHIRALQVPATLANHQ